MTIKVGLRSLPRSKTKNLADSTGGTLTVGPELMADRMERCGARSNVRHVAGKVKGLSGAKRSCRVEGAGLFDNNEKASEIEFLHVLVSDSEV